MAETITEVLTRSVTEVFNEPDGDRRGELAARTYAPDLVFHDPEGSVTGRSAFSAHVQPLLDAAAGMVFTLREPVQEVADLGIVRWQLGPAGQAPVTTGTDVALFSDGLIATMWTVLDT